MLSWACFATVVAVVVQGSYIITAPREWTVGETTRVCLYHVNATGRADELLKVTLQERGGGNVTSVMLLVEQGQTTQCYGVELPDGDYPSYGNKIIFEGEVGGKTVSDTRTLRLEKNHQKTFIQTDKYPYQPGQIVRFRILTIAGPSIRVSTDNYRIVYVETQSGTRLQQWLDLDNSRGLIHLQFQLSQEAEEGFYNIKVKTQNNITSYAVFKVEEYVLPKFEVTVTSTKILKGTDEGGNFRVCANYTFGQPVKGNATLKLRKGGFYVNHVEITKNKQIHGCQDFPFTFEEMEVNVDYGGARRIRATAIVTEDGTDVKIESDLAVATIHREVLDFQHLNKESHFKPGLPFTVRVAATHLNGTTASSEPMKACIGTLCRNFTTDASGIVSFYVPSSAINMTGIDFYEKIYIEAINYPEITRNITVMWQTLTSIYFDRYFSPSNSSLILRVPAGELDCKRGGHQLQLDLLFSANKQSKANVTVQVISRGQIRYQNTTEYSLTASPLPLDDVPFLAPMEPLEGVVVGAFKIPISLGELDSPKAKVLVWYTRDDGEVVSDLVELDIKQCLNNRVNMTWNKSKAEPGDPAILNLEAEPNSFCSFDVADKSVALLSGYRNELTIDRVLIFVERFIVSKWTYPQTNDHEHCSKFFGNDSEVPEVAADALALEKRDIYGYYEFFSTHTDASKLIDESGLFFITDLTTETRPCDRTSAVESYEELDKEGEGGYALGGSRGYARTYFPETWLWDLALIPENGQSLLEYTLPDTVTEWVGKTVCVHPQKGLGISSKSSITTFTPFFADLTLPPSVKRGEILPVKISVFNYLDKSLPVKVVLGANPDFDILGSEGEELVALGERSACVPAKEKVTHTIRIRPKQIGEVNLTVTSFVEDSLQEQCGAQGTVNKRDSLVKSIQVESEGFPREKVWTKYICTQELENSVDSLEKWRVESPPGIVEGSARSFVTASGDLLGPSFENLERLVRMPYGCGEQNMIGFTPNIYVQQYLTASQQITTDVVRRLGEYMEQGYQRELKYRHKDGSFSAFGESDDSGSNWLTAFVVKSFAQARQYIFIDENDLDVSVKWLKGHQREDGCFPTVGKVFSKALKGGLGKDSSAVSLTAYILIALLEAGEAPDSPVVQKAMSCLWGQETMTIYSQALASYAFALGEHPNAEDVLQRLLALATKSTSSIFWELPAGSSKGAAVEVAGYAVLAMMTLDKVAYDAEALKIVKWISSTRNGQGGFVSTQDTVVALQALASFSSTREQGGSNLTVTLRAEDLRHSFSIDEKNRILQQFVALPTLPTDVDLEMTGQGCSLLQAVLRYNVHLPDPTDAFSLRVNTKTASDSKCVTKHISACATYLLPDKKSNMAILEVNLVSGYVPVKEDLKQVVIDVQQVKRFDIDGSKVMFYIDEFTNEELCASFKVTREVDVADVKPGTVRIYDYYEPELSLDKSYILPPSTECYALFEPEIEAVTETSTVPETSLGTTVPDTSLGTTASETPSAATSSRI